MESPGSTNVFSGELAATVSVSAEGSPVEIARRFNSGSSDGVTTVSNPKWKAAQGWFVCVQSPDLIWAYDGNGYLDITQVTKLGTATRTIESLSGKVPDEVLNRLPENLKKAVQKTAQ